MHCALLRGFPTKLRAQISSDGTEPDDSWLRERTRELTRWHPKTRSFSSPFFFSVGENGLNRLVPCNASRWNLQERLYIESYLGETQFPCRNQHEFLIIGTFGRKRNYYIRA